MTGRGGDTAGQKRIKRFLFYSRAPDLLRSHSGRSVCPRVVWLLTMKYIIYTRLTRECFFESGLCSFYMVFFSPFRTCRFTCNARVCACARVCMILVFSPPHSRHTRHCTAAAHTHAGVVYPLHTYKQQNAQHNGRLLRARFLE